MPDDPIPPSKGLRSLNPDGLSEADQDSRHALLEAAHAFGVDMETLTEMENDARDTTTKR